MKDRIGWKIHAMSIDKVISFLTSIEFFLFLNLPDSNDQEEQEEGLQFFPSVPVFFFNQSK